MPATRASPWANVGGAIEESLRCEREDPGQVGQVRGGVHPHQDQVVALREDVLVELVRSLRDDDQIEAVLAALAGDPDDVGGGQRGQLVPWFGGTDVARLVDHDRNRLAAGPMSPQPLQHRSRDEGLFLVRRQRAEIDDRAAPGIRVVDLVRKRSAPGAGPDAQPVESEVAGAQLQRLGRGGRQVLDAGDRFVLDQIQQFARTRSDRPPGPGAGAPPMRRAEITEADLDRILSIRSTEHADALGSRRVALRRSPASIRARLTEADVVGVRIEHDEAKSRLHQQLLEQDAE